MTKPNTRVWIVMGALLGALFKNESHKRNDDTSTSSAKFLESFKLKIQNTRMPIIRAIRLVLWNYISGQLSGRGDNVLLPRIPMIPTGVSIRFRRLRLPKHLAFSMAVNESQGQTTAICRLDGSRKSKFFTRTIIHVCCVLASNPIKPSYLCIQQTNKQYSSYSSVKTNTK